jgi:hypothetical protein
VVYVNFRVIEGAAYQIILGLDLLVTLKMRLDVGARLVCLALGLKGQPKEEMTFKLYQRPTVRLSPAGRTWRDHMVHSQQPQVAPAMPEGSIALTGMDAPSVFSATLSPEVAEYVGSELLETAAVAALFNEGAADRRPPAAVFGALLPEGNLPSTIARLSADIGDPPLVSPDIGESFLVDSQAHEPLGIPGSIILGS